MGSRKIVPVLFGYDNEPPFLLAKKNAKAKMVGRKIYIRAQLSEFAATGIHNMRRVIKHELGHVRQYDKLGDIRFTLKYALIATKLYFRHWDTQKVHDLHPMELEAKAYALTPWTQSDLALLQYDIQTLIQLYKEEIV